MTFDSYIVSDTKTSLSMPLANLPKKLKRSKEFKGFTLAETLITLTIIGVVAALTIPTLMNKYTKHTYVVGLKKAYSRLSNAMKMIPITEGCSAGDYDCAGMFDGLSYDKGVWINNGEAVIDIDGQSFGGWVYSKQVYLLSKQFKTVDFDLNVGNQNKKCEIIQKMMNYDSNVPCFYTQDGMIISSSHGILVDINGEKGPNKQGRDQFMFVVAPETKNGIHQGTLLPSGSKALSDYDSNLYGGTWDVGKYWSDGDGYCTAANPNINCTGRVLEEDAMNY